MKKLCIFCHNMSLLHGVTLTTIIAHTVEKLRLEEGTIGSQESRQRLLISISDHKTEDKMYVTVRARNRLLGLGDGNQLQQLE